VPGGLTGASCTGKAGLINGLPAGALAAGGALGLGACCADGLPGCADGLAAGKGVKVCADVAQAKAFLFEVMEKEAFGSAGSTVVLEECLHGEETTIMAFCDGKTLVPMPASQDHKRLLDIAIQSFAAIKTGNVGVSGATGALLMHTLSELRELAGRALPNIRRASANTSATKTCQAPACS